MGVTFNPTIFVAFFFVKNGIFNCEKKCSAGQPDKEHFQNENSVLILFARLLNCFKLWDTAMPTFWMNSSLFQFQRPSLIESEKEEGNFFLFFNCSKEQIA